MTTLNRVRVDWSQFPGAPGVSTFYLDASTTNVAPLLTFFTAIKNNHPVGLTFTVPNFGDTVDSATGKITGTWSGAGGGTAVSSAVSSNYPGSAGAMVRWTTNVVFNGRRVAGRTFFVPMIQSKFDTTGTIDDATRTALISAAGTLITSYAGSLVVYGRPSDTPPPGHAAVVAPIVAATVPDLAVVLRSRRK